MMEFVLLVAAIIVSNLLSATIACVIVCNKKVMKKYTKWAMNVSNEIAEELFEQKD